MYSAFIAYHGSRDKNGSFNAADNIKSLLSKHRSKYEVYCGPDTDENTFEDHMARVIPNSELFVLVVNDYVPVDKDGALDEEKCKYLAAEIRAFLNLIQTKQRNVKNFAIYYAGNAQTTYEEKVAFAKTLLCKIDAKEELHFGNQYYICDLGSLLEWYKRRENTSLLDNPFSLDYVSFQPLEEALENAIKTPECNSFLLEMKKGMGKTTFIKHIRDDLYPRHNITIFFSRDEGYSSIGKFKRDFVTQLVGENEELFYLEDYGALNKENFAKYVNDFKRAFYNDAPLLICFDSIDDTAIIDDKSPVLELFSDLSLFDKGIFFVFTSKIPEQGRSYNAYIENFIKLFSGTKMKVDDQDIQYLKYLYLYYSNTISKNFNIDQIDVTELFENIKPKNIFTFSLLFYISNLYLSSNENKSIEIIKSTENALKFYYSYMKEHSEASEDYEKLLIGLFILSVSSKPLTLDDLDEIAKECFEFKISGSLIKYKNVLSILVNSYHDSEGKVVYDVRHEKIREMIEEDETNKVYKEKIYGVIDFSFVELKLTKSSFLDFVVTHKTIQYLMAFYLKNIQNKSKKIQVLQGILESLTNLSWGDTTDKIAAQESVLEKIVTLPEFEELSDIQKATFLTRLSIDEQQIDYNYDSYTHALKAFELISPHEKELNDRELYVFMDTTAALGNVGCRIPVDVPVVEMFRKSCEISETLFRKGIVPLRDYTNNILSYGNVASNIGGDLDTDEKCLKKAYDLIFSSSDVMDLGQRGWYYQRLANFYYRKGDKESAEKQEVLAFEAYLYAFKQAPESFYFGNLVELTGSYLAIKAKAMVDNKEIFNLIVSTEKDILTKAEKIKFHSGRNFVCFFNGIGNVYLQYNNAEQAANHFRKALNEINLVKEKTKLISGELQKYQTSLIEKLSKII